MNADPTTFTYVAGGTSIAPLTIGDWLEAGGINKALDERNSALTGDHRDPDHKIRMRFSGVTLNVDIQYENVNRRDGRPDPSTPPPISAAIRIKGNTKTYAGPGPEISWQMYPEGPRGQQRYHKVTRYRQGIVIAFNSATSKIYEFNFVYLITALCNAFVLVQIADVIVRLIALNALPFGVSKTIRNVVVERVQQEGTKLTPGDLEKAQQELTVRRPGATPANSTGQLPVAGTSSAGAASAARAVAPSAEAPSAEAPTQVQAASAQPAGAVSMPPMQAAPPLAPPGVVAMQCGACQRIFGSPSNARLVKCPFCQTTQGIPAQTV